MRSASKRFIAMSSLVLLSLGSFVMYYNPTYVNLYSTFKVSQKEDAHHNFLSMEGNTSKVLNPNRTSEKQNILRMEGNTSKVLNPSRTSEKQNIRRMEGNTSQVLIPNRTSEKQNILRMEGNTSKVLNPNRTSEKQNILRMEGNTSKVLIPNRTSEKQNILRMEENMSKVLNPSRTSEKISPRPNHTTVIQLKDEHTESDVLILIWFWPWGVKFDLSCSQFKFNINGCRLTDDRSLYNKSHAVLFHHCDINWELSNMPQQPRPWFQKWVWFNMEPPQNSHQIPKLNDLFNLTTNFRQDSNIPVRYAYLVPVTHEDERFKLPVKDKLVCWVVSNWNPRYKRVQFYNDLKKHIKIEAYGKAFGRKLNGDEFIKVISSCKFYLSFENSIYKDYITEKIYNPMKMGTVPVVLGTSRRGYEAHVPGDSFIHVDDFATPKELAERLIYLHNNHTEYMNYFHWTKRFKVKGFGFGQENACRVCINLQLNRGYESFHDLNKWYWG